MGLALWAAVFGTMWQLMVFIWGIVKFPAFVSMCRGASVHGTHNAVKNAMLLSVFSFAPLVVISITFMWVAYDNKWASGIVFVILPVLSILLFVLFLFGTVNDITKKIDTSRRGRKRLPMQAPPTLVVAPLNGSGGFPAPFVQHVEPGGARGGMTTPRRDSSAPPQLPLQASPM